MKTATLKMLVYSTVAAASVAFAFTTLRADSVDLRSVAVQGGRWPDRID